MTKFSGIRIRIGAAYDDVTIMAKGDVVAQFDRNQMRIDGHGKDQGELRRRVVEFAEERGIAKDRRAQRLEFKEKFKYKAKSKKARKATKQDNRKYRDEPDEKYA